MLFFRILWGLAVVVVGTFLFRQWKSRVESKKEKRNLLREEFALVLPQLQAAIDEFFSRTELKTGYFTYSQMRAWKEKYVSVFNEVNRQRFEVVVSLDDRGKIDKFKSYFTNCEGHRAVVNSSLIPNESNNYQALFDNVENRKLDEQQRRAIISDEDNNLVIAGAGSGKTTTIVGKVFYVLDRYGPKAEEILLISFTRKSASTISARLRIDGLEAKTFHKFGKDVIARVDGKQPLIYDENQFRQFIAHTFNSLISDPNYLLKVTDYFTDFIKEEKSDFEFEKHGDYIQYLKDQDYRPYRLVQFEEKRTWNREVVKSVQECKIANFLLFNGVDYKYELPYQYDTATSLVARWKPDFTITQDGITVYLEHFGVDRNGDVPPFFVKEGESYVVAKQRYRQKMEWARVQCIKDQTILIETYSYEMYEGILYDSLKTKLEAQGIKLRPKSPGEIWRIILDAARDDVSNVITLFQTFITLLKSNNYTLADISARNRQLNRGFLEKRTAHFLELVSPIAKKYEEHLAARGEIDFSDMINKAGHYINSGQFKQKFSYIIVDEFQDISIGRYHLIKAIKEVNPGCKLFCVGDDWQSIYRFSGSDISLFSHFKDFFGYTAMSRIETTYRFHNPMLTLSSKFIQKNPNQVKKELRSASTTKATQHQIIYSVSDSEDDTEALKVLLDSLAKTDPAIAEKEFLLLGRYNHDINRIKNQPPVFSIRSVDDTPVITYDASVKGGTIKIQFQFLTVHKAKGLEADIVIVLNCNSGKRGFPSEMADDPVLNLLLSEADQYENGEERRLFYVAMTRAKERTYFITDHIYKSKFINELEGVEGNRNVNKCPKCKSGDVVKRSGITAGKPWAFNACSNYAYGCEYRAWIR